MNASFLFSAGAHFQLYSAAKYADSCENFEFQERINFLVGAIFPEIWMMSKGRIGPDHETVSLARFKEETRPFYKGILFHHLINKLEQEVVLKLDYNRRLPATLNVDEKLVLKNMIEQIVVYPKTSSLAKSVMQNLTQCDLHLESDTIGYSRSDVLHWFMGISGYFQYLPQDRLENIKESTFLDTGQNLKLTDDLLLDLSKVALKEILTGDSSKEFLICLKLELDKLCNEIQNQKDNYESAIYINNTFFIPNHFTSQGCWDRHTKRVSERICEPSSI